MRSNNDVEWSIYQTMHEQLHTHRSIREGHDLEGDCMTETADVYASIHRAVWAVGMAVKRVVK